MRLDETVERARPVSLMSSARVRGVPSSMSWSSSPAPDEPPDELNGPTVVTKGSQTQPADFCLCSNPGILDVAQLLLDVQSKVGLASRGMAGNDASALLGMADIVKRFPGVVALGGVDLDVRPGEVHCLLGQNGAGKSTLIKVLAGVHQPDEGSITWQGRDVTFAHPQAAMDLGIATIYQELDLVEGLTVAENIYLGHERSRFGFSQRRSTTRAAAALLQRLGHTEISPSTEVGDLSAAGKQIVSMARALSHDAKLIIMDEPSAVLDAGEVDRLFHVIRDLTAEGVAVVYISHRLEEIRAIGDRVTVLKDGKTVATGLSAKQTPTSEVIRLMTGRAIEYVFPPRGAKPTAEPILRVENITRRGEFADVSFDVRPGEVVGLAGLVGAGRSEIIETVFGARRSDSGSVHLDGSRLRPGSVQSAVGAGIGLCPEERKSQALFLGDSIATNISMASLTRFSRGGLLDHDGERRAAEEQGQGPGRATRQGRRRDADAVRRQPAEGRPGPLAAQGLQGPPARRANSRRRRRRPLRDLRPGAPARRQRRRRRRGVERDRGGPRPLRPRPGHRGGKRAARRYRAPRSTSTACSTSS